MGVLNTTVRTSLVCLSLLSLLPFLTTPSRAASSTASAEAKTAISPDQKKREANDIAVTVVVSGIDPQAELVLAQRVAIATALARGIDPDRPRHLARSVMYTGQ